MLRLLKVSDPQVTPDERLLFLPSRAPRLDRNTGQSSIWVQPLSAAGQSARDQRIRLRFRNTAAKAMGGHVSPRLSPNSGRLAFLSTRDGGPPQLYVMSLAGGEARKADVAAVGVVIRVDAR